MTGFQHPLIFNKDNKHPPLFGPLFLMMDRKESSVKEFAFGLWEKWGDISLVTGTDQEDALRNPSKFFFRDGMAVLCTQHLEDNAVRHMNVAKVADKATQKEIIDFVFCKGKHYEDGLIAAKDELEFWERKVQAGKYRDCFPDDKFDTLTENLWEFVVKPRTLNDGIQFRWKNNVSRFLLNIL